MCISLSIIFHNRHFDYLPYFFKLTCAMYSEAGELIPSKDWNLLASLNDTYISDD